MIITSDLHLTDRARDEYRWELFPWLIELVEETGSDEVLILGDLTDAKNNHSAELVNRMVKELTNLPAHVYVLKGNHDYVDPDQPFFGFLNEIPGVRFVTHPEMLPCLQELGLWPLDLAFGFVH